MVAIAGTVGLPQSPMNRPVELEVGDVHIWCVNAEGCGPMDGGCLDRQERERADRFQFARHANAFRCAHVMRRSVLGEYLAQQPDALHFETGSHGRPRLSAIDGNIPAIQFNASSSLPVSLLAVTVSGSVGIDVERSRPVPDALRIAQTQFLPDEGRQVSDRSRSVDRQDAFFRCWTRKEAVVEAMGTGLHTELDIFFVGADPETPEFRPRFVDPGNVEDWWLVDLSQPPIYCALALSRRPKCIWIGSWPA